MGNALSASNPTEIHPVEYYLSDFADSIESLGSTRFMKVARGRNSSNAHISVFKVFLIQDDSLVLDSYRKEIFRIRDALVTAPNCSTVRRIYQKPRYAVLERPFQKSTLSDRLSSRPTIKDEERLWYIYQLFKALYQLEKANVCHGDVKSQNIAISSSNWLQLTDFASFKPTYLQNDNPSSFTFFFDTSRLQSCNLAPERFLSSADYEYSYKKNGESWLYGSLLPSMDMFSAGCVVYELLCDGKSPFSYGQLCDYRAMNSNDAASHLERLLLEVLPEYRPLLKMLLNREPTMRMTSGQVLEGAALRFPHIMEFFFNYLNAFRPKDLSASHSMEDVSTSHASFCFDPDLVIAKLKRDKASVWARLEESESTRPFAILLIPLITSNMRSLRSSQAKVDAMALLIELSSFCDSTVSIERVLPYFVSFLWDHQASVRSRAIHSIVALTSPLEPSSVEDSLIFIDYLLPELVLVVSDKRQSCPTHVLLSLSYNLGKIAQIAHRFLTVGRSLRDGMDDECSGAENLSEAQQWEDEGTALAKAITDLFVTLCDAGNTVRHCLVHPLALAPLYSFFHKMGNSEILLRHMITFLNRKNDWRLRAAFFDALPICLQKKSVDVRSLLHQGLHDFEEFVIVRVLNCINILVEAELLDRSSTVALLRDTAPFLFHPNEWIRAGVVNLVIILDSRWSIADRYCRLFPELTSYTNGTKLLRLNHKLAILNCLRDPIPRDIWKKVMTDMNEDQTSLLLPELELCLRQERSLSTPWFTKVFGSEAVDLDLMFKLSMFKNHLQKMATFRNTVGMEGELTRQKGTVDLSSRMHVNVKRNSHIYAEQPRHDLTVRDINSEWKEMFGAQVANDRPLCTSAKSISGFQLMELLRYKEELHARSRRATHRTRTPVVHTASRITGSLVTHLHEHSRKITQLATHPEGQKFASSSLDGTLKLWSVRTITGECYGAARSDVSFKLPDDPALNSIGWVGRSQLLGIAAANGVILWSDVPNDFKALSKVQIPSEEGAPEQILLEDNLMFVRTHHGVLYCLDRRVGRSNGPLKNHEVWRREVSKSYGLVTSFCIDPWKSNWMAMGCTNCQIMLWDLRYQREFTYWYVPDRTSTKIPIKIWNNPCSSSESPEIFVALQERGEVGVYDITTQTRTRVLWPSLAPPLQYNCLGAEDGDIRNQSAALCVCQKTGSVYTGDSYGALRKWTPAKALDCSYLSGPRKDEGRSPYRVAYDDRAATLNSPAIIFEKRVPNRDPNAQPPIAIETSASTFHRTPISDVIALGSEYLASAGVDGVIKVWK